jgi:hypothetical protein
MKTLLIELMNWFVMSGYRKASFNRLLGVLESASTYDQFNELLNEYHYYLRPATLKGGFPGLALREDIYPYRVLERENPTTPAPVVDAPLITLPASWPMEEVLAQPETVPTNTAADVPPPVQPTAMEAEIKEEYFRNLGSALKTPDGPAANVTLCVFVLHNGFVIVGKSACVDRANFNEETGKRLAREDAIKQITPYLGWRRADARMAAADYPEPKF